MTLGRLAAGERQGIDEVLERLPELVECSESRI
jgi:hypothetical protein